LRAAIWEFRVARGGVESIVVLVKPQERKKRPTILNKQTNGVAVIINKETNMNLEDSDEIHHQLDGQQ